MARRKVFSWGRTRRAVTIYISFKGKIVGRLPRKHVVFYDGPSKKHGHLRDGRPVVYKKGKWIFKMD